MSKINWKEFQQSMEECGLSGGSDLHLRSETLQHQKFAKGIPMLKKSLKKKSKLLIPIDLAIPFDPETGSTAVFNEKNKFRPPFSATTVALNLKSLANENQTTKEIFIKKAGVSEWDTSETEVLNEKDKYIFARYRMPRIFTIPAVHVDIPVMTSNEYGKDYAINVQRDDTGSIIGDVPGVLKIAKLFNDRNYEEIRDYEERVKKGEIKASTQMQKDFKASVRRKSPVSSDRPLNYACVYELSLTPKYYISSEIDLVNMEADQFEDIMVLTKIPTKIRQILEKYKSGEYEKFDRYFDFFEFDMSCPTSGDDKTDAGRAQMGIETEYEKPSYTINGADFSGAEEQSANEVFKEFYVKLVEHLDSLTDIESRVKRSVYIEPYSDTIEDLIFSTLHTVLNLSGDEFFTEKVIKSNAEVISLALGDEANEFLLDVEMGDSDKTAGVLDETESEKSAKEYDLNSELFGAETDDISSDEDSVSVDSFVDVNSIDTESVFN